jgi:hypothetical protein
MAISSSQVADCFSGKITNDVTSGGVQAFVDEHKIFLIRIISVPFFDLHV